MKGFTIVELLVVIVIMGILATMAVPKFLALREEEQQEEYLYDTSEPEQSNELSYICVDNLRYFPVYNTETNEQLHCIE